MMTIKIILAAMAFSMSLFSPDSAYANGKRVETRYFSAEVINVRRAQSGNVIVTIKFQPKIDETAKLYIYSDVIKSYETRDSECPGNNTILIDGDGEEHTAQNCLPPLQKDSWGVPQYQNGMELHSGSDAFFVYKFGLASASKEALQNINLTIPMHYNHCVPRQQSSTFSMPSSPICSPSVMTLSFYGISTN